MNKWEFSKFAKPRTHCHRQLSGAGLLRMNLVPLRDWLDASLTATETAPRLLAALIAKALAPTNARDLEPVE